MDVHLLMRARMVSAIASVLLIAACASSNPVASPATNPSQVSQGVSFQLYTHCGIRFADFNGRRFYADPPLDDGIRTIQI
jgi:hypothetical protein